MVDTINGLQVLNFDGRLLSQPKFGAMRPDALSAFNVAYSNDLLAIIDAADQKVGCHATLTPPRATARHRM